MSSLQVGLIALILTIACASDSESCPRSLRGGQVSVSASAQGRRSVVGKHGMVSTSHPLAAQAGARILERGGNAVDAAIAVHLVLAVVEPQHLSIGGGGVMLHKKLGQPVEHVDFLEEAPALYHPKTFCRNTQCITDPECSCEDGAWPPDERCAGGHTSGVPGLPYLLALAERDNLTSIPLPELAKPAIEIAREGFEMYAGLFQFIESRAPHLARDEAARDIFLSADGTTSKAQMGEIFRQPLLAETLALLAAAPLEFYSGDLGREFVEAARKARNPVTGKYGLLTQDDLLSYRAVYRQPVEYTHESASGEKFNIAGSAPPFSGGVGQAQMFNYMEQLTPRAGGNASRELGFFLDAQNAAFADRNQYVADMDFVDVDVEGLTSKAYAAARVAELFGPSGPRLDSAPQRALGLPISPGAPRKVGGERGASHTEDHGTVHMSIMDAQGSVVAMTSSVNFIMGSRVAVPGRGYLLNDRLCDFDAVGVDTSGTMTVNAAEGGKRPRRTAKGTDKGTLGGKRPRSSMSPSLIWPAVCAEPGSAACAAAPFLVLGTGAPGSNSIIGGVANVMRNVFGARPSEVRELQRLTDAPRALGKNSLRLGSAVVELALWEDQATRTALEAWGYNLTHTEAPPPYYVGETYSRVQSAMLVHSASQPDAWEFVGAADSMRLPACTVVAPGAPATRSP